MQFQNITLDDLDKIANYLVSHHSDTPIWLFQGEMGAGKTTLIKSICDLKRVVDNVSSPTFSIVNEYLTDEDEVLYHFDFYRIEDEKEAVDIGVDEYFYSRDLCLIEWSERIPSLIPDEYVEINIKLGDSNERNFFVTKHGGEDKI